MQIEWLSKEQVAKRLKVSTRTVLAMAAEGKIQRRQERDPASNQMTTRLHAGDVERIAYERQHPAVQPVRPVIQEQPPQALQASPGPFIAALSRLAQNLPSAPAPSPAWLTLEQASAYIGLSRELLYHLVRSGGLPALRDQPIKAPGKDRATAGSSWRVCRADLDALRGSVLSVNDPASACT